MKTGLLTGPLLTAEYPLGSQSASQQTNIGWVPAQFTHSGLLDLTHGASIPLLKRILRPLHRGRVQHLGDFLVRRA